MKSPNEILKTEGDIRVVLGTVYDPEVELNIVDLGLIYRIHKVLSESNHSTILI